MKNKIVKHFYVKEAKKDSKGAAPIYLRITVNGERAEISTDRKVKPDDWDKVTEKVSGRSEAARIVNVALDNLKGKGINQMTLIKAYDFHIKKLEELSGIDFAVTTINKYRSL
jgi:hypothetical protein